MADLYRSKVEELATALQRDDTRLEASESLRGLIDSSVLTPEDGQPPSRARDAARAAASLEVAFGGRGKTKRSPAGDPDVPIELVAGAGFAAPSCGPQARRRGAHKTAHASQRRTK
jgi:hypothetical protein